MALALPVGRRRRALQRLRDDQDLLEALLDSVEVAIMAWTADGRLAHTSRRMAELLGAECPRGGDPEAWFRDLRPRTPSGIPLVREDLPHVRALQGEVLSSVDVLVRLPRGDSLLCATARPVEDQKSRRRGAIVLLEDVTQRRRDEVQLRASSHPSVGRAGARSEAPPWRSLGD